MNNQTPTHSSVSLSKLEHQDVTENSGKQLRLNIDFCIVKQQVLKPVPSYQQTVAQTSEPPPPLHQPVPHLKLCQRDLKH